jgi:hypothetical protein
VPMQRSLKDVLAGLALAAFGVAFAIGAMTYTVGSPVRMGPGFFPLIVGALLATLGVVIAIRPVLDGEDDPITQPAWRGLVLILGSIVVFGLTVRGLGLVPAVFVTALIASLASQRTGTLGALLLAVTLTVLCVLIFVVGLSLRLPLLGPWLPRI